MNSIEQLRLAALKAAAEKAMAEKTAGQKKTKTTGKTGAKKTNKSATTTAHKDTAKVSGGAKYVIPAAFKAAIEKYLATRPDVDTKKTGKSIDKCCEYIYDKMRKEAQKQSKNGGMVGLFHENEEIYSIAVHYFDESDEDLKKEAEDEKK